MWRKLFDVAFWLGASAYFGGMLAVGAVVAPSVFDTATGAKLTMPGIALPLEMARQVGGEIFGDILNRFAYVEGACIALMLVGIIGWFLGHRHVRRSTWVVAILWMMLTALFAVDSAWLRPRVFALRTTVRQEAPLHVNDAAGPAAPSNWPARAEFDRLHDWSESLGRLKVYCLLAMILVTAWRGLAESRGFHGSDRRDVMRKVLGVE